MAEATVEILQENDSEQGRFVLMVDNKEAGDMTYVWTTDTVFTIEHTTVDEAYGGKGYARQLVNEGVAYARRAHKKIIAECPYAKRALHSDEQYADVLAGS